MTDTPPMPPAGWYDVPTGGKRFWNGRAWSTDVIGASSAQAEYAALDPYLPAPPTEVIPAAPQARAHSAAQLQPAGWYPGPTGALQWWDGRQWGPFAPPTAAISRPAKEVGIAYLFLFLLGGFSAHRFYLGLVGSAIVFNVLWWGGWILAGLAIGIPMMVAAGIWWFVDLFLLPSLVRNANARALAPTPMTLLPPTRRL
jgi:TM2 domain-containing membrane protein YozV